MIPSKHTQHLLRVHKVGPPKGDTRTQGQDHGHHRKPPPGGHFGGSPTAPVGQKDVGGRDGALTAVRFEWRCERLGKA